MNITNGTVEFSHPVKLADYQIKHAKVSLSYTVAEGEDAEAVIDRVHATVFAKTMELLSKMLVSNKADVRDKPVQAKQPPKAAVEIVGGDHAVHDEPMAEEVAIVTDDALVKACQRTTKRLGGPQHTKDVIAEYVEGYMPGMSVRSIVQEKRAAFIEALDALKSGE